MCDFTQKTHFTQNKWTQKRYNTENKNIPDNSNTFLHVSTSLKMC